jgi:hypothetical protein
MKVGASFNLLGELTKRIFKSESCHHINSILICLAILVRFFPICIIALPHYLLFFEALFHIFLVAVYYKLLVESWIHRARLVQFIECLLLFV